MSKKYQPFDKDKWTKQYLYETANDIIDICNRELRGMDGTCLSSTDKDEIRKMYQEHPILLALIANAYESKGYDSF